MNLEEAQKIADIISSADGGCPHCVYSLGAQLQREFPEFTFFPVRVAHNLSRRIGVKDEPFTGDPEDMIYGDA